MNIARITLMTFLLTFGQVRDTETVDVNTLISRLKDGGKLAPRLRSLDEAVRVASPAQRITVMNTVVELAELCRPEKLKELSTATRHQRLQGASIFDHFLAESCRSYAADEQTRDALLEMLLATVLSDNSIMLGQRHGAAFERLMEFSPNELKRKAYALEIIERQRAGVGWRALKYIRDQSCFDDKIHLQFRDILRVSLEKGKPNRLVLSVLGYLGDKQILPDLEEFAAVAPPGSEQMRLVKNAIWEIKIQHPPEGLVQFLEEGRHDANPIRIVQRAVDLDLSKEDLRHAVQSYYKKCPAEKLRFFRISGLDGMVVTLGLLTVDELPARDW